jgi:hypothetical protein
LPYPPTGECWIFGTMGLNFGDDGSEFSGRWSIFSGRWV